MRAPIGRFRSKRLLALAGDDRLVEQIRRGNEVAFEVAFERHGAGILGFCRHMLASPEEAEDAVQHTFAAAYRDLQRGGEHEIALKSWLYAIARNRCLSVLRARREHAVEQPELATAGLADQVERRSELRELLADLRELPEEQRAALLLSEVGDLSHADVAGVLGCEATKVKALVYRARSGLMQRREARETPCEEIREQLANLRGGSLRRSELRHHLRHCPGCQEYRAQVKQQRQLLAAALPVAPSLGLKSSVLAAVGLGGGSAGGGAIGGLGGLGAGTAGGAGAGLGAGSAGAGVGGLGAALTGSLGTATLAKVAVVGVLAGGGLVAGKAAVDEVQGSSSTPPAAAGTAAPSKAKSHVAIEKLSSDPSRGERLSTERRGGARGEERRSAQASERHEQDADTGERGRARAEAVQRRARERHSVVMERSEPRGRGPIEAPPEDTPVKRGPFEPKLKAEPRAKTKPAPPPPPAAVPESAPVPEPTATQPETAPTSDEQLKGTTK